MQQTNGSAKSQFLEGIGLHGVRHIVDYGSCREGDPLVINLPWEDVAVESINKMGVLNVVDDTEIKEREFTAFASFVSAWDWRRRDDSERTEIR